MTSDNKWYEYIRNYRFNSIFVKNLFLIMGVIILPFIAVLYLSFSLYGNMRTEEISTFVDTEMVRITSQIESMVDEVRHKAILIGADNDVNAYIRTAANGSDAETINDISSTLSIFKVASTNIDSIYIYFPETDTVISQAGMYRRQDFNDQLAIDAIDKEDDLYHFRYLSRIVSKKTKRTLSLYYRYEYKSENAPVIIINLDPKKVRDGLNYADHVNVELWKDGKELYSDAFLSGAEILDPTHNIEMTHNVIRNDLDVLIRIDTSVLRTNLETIQLILVWLVVLMMVVTVILVYYISKKIYNPIRDIMSLLEKVDMFEVDENSLLQNKDEVQAILESIQASANDKKLAENELVEKLALLKTAQAIALQSQINPHFLNNTLETINWMAVKHLGASNDISTMLNALSSLLRMSLERVDMFVTLREEIHYAETYLYLQQKRLNNKLRVNWSVPEELLECKTVKVVLQPIIENAIKYGIIPYDEEGTISICATYDSDTIYIAVSDSGLGLPQNQIEEINKSIHSNVIKESSHIGLSNVNQRLALAYGEEYGIDISSDIVSGTTVTIKIPLQGKK